MPFTESPRYPSPTQTRAASIGGTLSFVSATATGSQLLHELAGDHRLTHLAAYATATAILGGLTYLAGKMQRGEFVLALDEAPNVSTTIDHIYADDPLVVKTERELARDIRNRWAIGPERASTKLAIKQKLRSGELFRYDTKGPNANKLVHALQ